MTTGRFIKTLDENKTKELQFSLPDGTVRQGDLHITELKSVSVKSVDCGGRPHDFTEQVMQIWLNESSDKTETWTASKALSIIEKVRDQIELEDKDSLYVEYGDNRMPAGKYRIGEMNETDGVLRIALKPQPVACKPRLEFAGACC